LVWSPPLGWKASRCCLPEVVRYSAIHYDFIRSPCSLQIFAWSGQLIRWPRDCIFASIVELSAFSSQACSLAYFDHQSFSFLESRASSPLIARACTGSLIPSDCIAHNPSFNHLALPQAQNSSCPRPGSPQESASLLPPCPYLHHCLRTLPPQLSHGEEDLRIQISLHHAIVELGPLVS